ncbi:MAG: hypothetical protein IPP01_01930 [Saprospiraceae bacterium]|nr:hypothetical protein [Saprospiraceae bacterium]
MQKINYNLSTIDFNSALRRLRKSGIILWYEQAELQDWIWLRPDQVVADFHNLLSKDNIAKCNGRISQSIYEDNFKDIADLLETI